MSTAPHGMGETATTYHLAHQLFADRLAEVAAIFIAYPRVQATSIQITPQGRIEITAEGVAGVLRDWAHAVPEHKMRTALVATAYGADEADVLETDHLKVVVRRPLVGPGGVA
jgi:hypothetical protein